jgi:predicted NBD/HSP70 family sugar kinase
VSSLPAALVRAAASVGLIDEVDELDPAAVEQALTVVSGLADEGSPAALAIIDGCAQNFARVAADLANILDLDTIIFGGPNWSLFERRFLAIVPAELNRRVVARAVHQVAVAGTALGDDVGAIGAASLIMSRDFASANSQLLAPA